MEWKTMDESSKLRAPFTQTFSWSLAFFGGLVGGLTVSRMLYEGLFPRALWAGSSLFAVLLGLAAAAGGGILWRTLARRWDAGRAVAPFLPLLLNTLYLGSPTISLAHSYLLFAGSLWLSALLYFESANPSSPRRRYLLVLVALLLPIYLLTLGRTVGRADTFEFQVVIPRLGIVHPTGYPLYLLLGRLFTFVPLGTVAWRVNLASATYALIAASLLFLLARRLARQSPAATLAAAAFALLPTFWSQAIEAEVYTLHALFVTGALWLMVLILGKTKDPGESRGVPRFLLLLAFLLGLGLTNHLTTMILLPAAALTLFFANRRQALPGGRFFLKLALAFLAPLLLYAYLPLRWSAVNGEAMGLARFIDWVIGGRFQGALQLMAWLRDPARYEVVARLLLGEWQPPALLLLAPLGLALLFRRQWRAALLLFITWIGYLFYGLNYYVPDLSVFLLPADLILAVWWAIGLAGLLAFFRRRSRFLAAVLFTIVGGAILMGAAGRWESVDRSRADGRTRWGTAVLSLPLEQDGAILADSERFPPLYYLQQAEGLRPDLSIMVLPDEAAYRAELNSRLAAGETVYLARYLPGLEAIYHLRSLGPLVEVGRQPLETLPTGVTPHSLDFGAIRLRGFQANGRSAADPSAAELTLYWQGQEPVDEVLHVYVRWATANDAGPTVGRHPAGDSYPTVAWETGEIVPDYHLIPRPALPEGTPLQLQAALAPPFTHPDELAWRTVTTVPAPAATPPASAQPLRAQIGSLLLTAIEMPTEARPGAALHITYAGCGPTPGELRLSLRPVAAAPAARAEEPQAPARCQDRFVRGQTVDSAAAEGRYALVATHPAGPARCGWLAPRRRSCALGEIEISGVPLPEGAANFGDRIALLDIDLGATLLQPGGRLAVDLTWKALAPIEENYTVFVQVIDEQDRIVGQVDSWPLQGTRPTAGWEAGEEVSDPYLIPLDEALAPGRYRLLTGLYLLRTGQRLPLLAEDGSAIDDRIVVPGLFVAE